MEELWEVPRTEPVIPEGAKQVADWLLERLDL